AGAHVVPAEILAFLLGPGTNGADQADVARCLQREDGDEVALVDRPVELTVRHRTLRLHIGDVEEVLVSAAGKMDAEFLANGRMCTVAASDERDLARRTGQTRDDAPARLVEGNQVGAALDADAHFLEPLDEKALVRVLRVDQR